MIKLRVDFLDIESHGRSNQTVCSYESHVRVNTWMNVLCVTEITRHGLQQLRSTLFNTRLVNNSQGRRYLLRRPTFFAFHSCSSLSIARARAHSMTR